MNIYNFDLIVKLKRLILINIVLNGFRVKIINKIMILLIN